MCFVYSLVLMKFSFGFPFHSATPTNCCRPVLLTVFDSVCSDCSGPWLEPGSGPGHGHRKRFSGIFQQFIALCYFAERVFWSAQTARASIWVASNCCCCHGKLVPRRVAATATAAPPQQLHSVPNSKHFGRIAIPRKVLAQQLIHR